MFTPRRPGPLAAVHIVNRGWETDSVALAAALLAVGIPLNPNFPCERYEGEVGEQGRLVFFFEDGSPCGKFKTAELVAAWADLPQFIRTFPEHPFSYAACATRNRDRVIHFVKSRAPQVVVRNGDKLAVISADAPSVQVDKILARLNR